MDLLCQAYDTLVKFTLIFYKDGTMLENGSKSGNDTTSDKDTAFAIVKRTTLGALLLLLMPLAVWASGWQWQPGEGNAFLRTLYWITQTVTRPWGILTSALLIAWFLWCLRFQLRGAIGLALLLAAAILIGQQLKSLVKDHVQAPRPFVVWMEQQYQVDNQAFYQLKRADRGALVEEQLRDNQVVPPWLKAHWQFETGFSFPSGHTLFAASWALLGIGLLWPRRRYKTIALLVVWAVAVMGSRLMLGMHWPRDLVMATVMSWVLVTLACCVVQRFIGPLNVERDEHREIAARENSKQ